MIALPIDEASAQPIALPISDIHSNPPDHETVTTRNRDRVRLSFHV